MVDKVITSYEEWKKFLAENIYDEQRSVVIYNVVKNRKLIRRIM